MIFRLLILSFSFFAVTQLFSQSTFTVYNDGLSVSKLEAGLTATIVGNFVSQTNVTDGQIDNQSTIQVSGNWTNNNSTSNVFSTQAGEVELNGSAAQIIDGSQTTSFNNLIVNNTSTGITCNIETKVDGNLTLTDGIIYTSGANTLTIEDNATSTSGSNASFVDGPMKKIGNDNFVFPVGDGVKWARIGVDNSASANTNTEFTAQYFRSGYANATVDVSLNNVSHLEYWGLSRAVNADNTTITLYWSSAVESDINDWASADLVVARFTGANWTDVGQGAITSGNVSSGVAISDFSGLYFTFGSNSPLVNILPIELLEFTATKINTYVELNWSTASEVNNDYFTIEKTLNHDTVFEVAKVNSVENSNTLSSYSATDLNPFTGVSFYRLKQTDINGDFSYSDWVAVNFNTELTSEINIYPNPIIKTESIYVDMNGLNKNSEVLIVVNDIYGHELYSKVYITDMTSSSIFAIDVNKNIPSGIYFIIATSQDKIYNKKVVIQ